MCNQTPYVLGALEPRLLRPLVDAAQGDGVATVTHLHPWVHGTRQMAPNVRDDRLAAVDGKGEAAMRVLIERFVRARCEVRLAVDHVSAEAQRVHLGKLVAREVLLVEAADVRLSARGLERRCGFVQARGQERNR